MALTFRLGPPAAPVIRHTPWGNELIRVILTSPGGGPRVGSSRLGRLRG